MAIASKKFDRAQVNEGHSASANNADFVLYLQFLYANPNDASISTVGNSYGPTPK